jgi:hypothetical protein
MATPKEEIRQLLETVDDSATFEDIQQRIRQREEELLPSHLIEHRQIAVAGKRLAGSVWAAEDFSDWEVGHGKAKAG